MDFEEYMIKKHTTPADILIAVLCYTAAIVIGLAVMLILFQFRLGSIALFALAASIYGAYALTSTRKKEFEYTVTGDTVDIDVIMNKRKRKRLLSFAASEIVLIAAADDIKYKQEFNSQFSSVIDASSGSKINTVYFAIIDKEARILLKFEPTYSILKRLDKYAHSRIHIKEL